MKILFLVLAGFIALTTIPAYAEQPLAKPGVLNEESVMTDQRLSRYDTIIIRDFTTDDAVYTRIDAEEKPKVDAIKPMVVSMLASSLDMEMKTRKLFKNVVRTANGTANAVILEGEFTEFNAGNRALRFWVGFGAGKTYLKVRGRLVDAASGTVLATFEDQESGYRGAVTMESFMDLFPHQAKSLGGHIAEFVEKLY